MRILLTGQCTLHWGRMEFGNIGNYYIMEPFVRELHRNFPGASIVTTFQLSEGFCTRENVSTLPMDLYYGWSEMDLDLALKELALATLYNRYGLMPETTPYIDEVKKSDLVIDFSGDIWGDNADFLGPHRFLIGLCKNRVAQLLNKKTAMLAGSPGPFEDGEILEFAKDTFRNFDLVTNRESISTDLLKDQGFNLEKTESLACPAFLFEPTTDKEKIQMLLQKEGVAKDRPLIGFVVCGWNFLDGPFDKWPRPDADYDLFAEAVEHIVKQLNARVVLMSHANGFDPPPAPFVLKHGRDYPIIKQLQDIVMRRGKVDASDVIALDGVYNAWDTKAIIGNFDMLVSGRVHAAVAALSQTIPTVIIDYGHEPRAHKLQGFAKVAGVEDLVADPSKRGELLHKIQQCWEQRDTIKSHLETRIPEVQNTARDNFRLLKQKVTERLQ